MSNTVPERRPLPADALECRQNAEQALTEPAPLSACAWALLAIAAELGEIRRSVKK
ncbi:hypothetical protein ACIO3R_32325 [Streptomyces sp. NPDC087428]|uniref:hypothetical protein n=1 Tax=Streptomyces sp. NPDC087428 TaxID=3365788 RepID=UPI003807B9DE